MLSIYGTDGFWRRIDQVFATCHREQDKGLNAVFEWLLLRGNSLIKLFSGTLGK
jgi:hypothetical protein